MCNDEIYENRLQMIGKLTSSFIHDLRNPLSVVKLNLEYLNMLENKLPAEVINSLLNTSKAVVRIQDLIDNLSGFTRQSIHEVELIEIVNHAIGYIGGSARRLNIKIENKLSGGIQNIYLDKNKILQVILNLLSCLIEVSGPDSLIEFINYNDSNDNLILEIRETGQSNKKEKQKKIKSLTKNKKNENCFGLSVCRSILKEYQSELSIETDENYNSKFVIKFQPLLIQNNYELQNTNH